jgi:hypothetical protein
MVQQKVTDISRNLNSPIVKLDPRWSFSFSGDQKYQTRNRKDLAPNRIGHQPGRHKPIFKVIFRPLFRF